MTESPRGTDTSLADVLGPVRNRLDSLMAAFEEVASAEDADAWLELRARLGRAVGGIQDVLGHADLAFGVTSARERILRYLQLRRGQVVRKEALQGVAGISEWARRIRELREDFGWVVHTHTTDASMSPGEYRLDSLEPRPELVEAWSAAKEAAKIRVSGGMTDPAGSLRWLLERLRPAAVGLEQAAHAVGAGSDLKGCISELERRGCRIMRLSRGDPLFPSGLRMG